MNAAASVVDLTAADQHVTLDTQIHTHSGISDRPPLTRRNYTAPDCGASDRCGTRDDVRRRELVPASSDRRARRTPTMMMRSPAAASAGGGIGTQ